MKMCVEHYRTTAKCPQEMELCPIYGLDTQHRGPEFNPRKLNIARVPNMYRLKTVPLKISVSFERADSKTEKAET